MCRVYTPFCLCGLNSDKIIEVNEVKYFVFVVVSEKSRLEWLYWRAKRIAKASSAFGRLKKSVWERRGISHRTKVKVYRAVVLTTLLYGCETWTIYERHEKKLHQFHLRCLRCIFNIRGQDKISDTEVLEDMERAQLPNVITTMRKAQTRWAGHVFRMSDSTIPKQLLYGELSQGARKVGGQRKRFKDSLKAYLKDFKGHSHGILSYFEYRQTYR